MNDQLKVLLIDERRKVSELNLRIIELEAEIKRLKETKRAIGER